MSMFHKAVVAQQVDAVGGRHVQVKMLQIQQCSKPHARFNVPSLCFDARYPGHSGLLDPRVFFLDLFQDRKFGDKWQRSFTGRLSLLSRNQQYQSNDERKLLTPISFVTSSIFIHH